MALNYRLNEAGHHRVPKGTVLKLLLVDYMAATLSPAVNNQLGKGLATKEDKLKDMDKEAEKDCMLGADNSLEVSRK